MSKHFPTLAPTVKKIFLTELCGMVSLWDILRGGLFIYVAIKLSVAIMGVLFMSGYSLLEDGSIWSVLGGAALLCIFVFAGAFSKASEAGFRIKGLFKKD